MKWVRKAEGVESTDGRFRIVVGEARILQTRRTFELQALEKLSWWTTPVEAPVYLDTSNSLQELKDKAQHRYGLPLVLWEALSDYEFLRSKPNRTNDQERLLRDAEEKLIKAGVEFRA